MVREGVSQWLTPIVSVNGTNYTNIWVATSSLPAQVDDFWYVGYASSSACVPISLAGR